MAPAQSKLAPPKSFADAALLLARVEKACRYSKEHLDQLCVHYHEYYCDHTVQEITNSTLSCMTPRAKVILSAPHPEELTHEFLSRYATEPDDLKDHLHPGIYMLLWPTAFYIGSSCNVAMR